MKPLFPYVKKQVQMLVVNFWSWSLLPCTFNHHGNSKCCKLIKEEMVSGNCKSWNLIYLVSCALCWKAYIGRTVQQISSRISGHRDCFYQVLRNDDEADEIKDDYSLGLHLANEHGCLNRTDFNDLYSVKSLENCRPADLGKKEHTYIHKSSTLFH